MRSSPAARSATAIWANPSAPILVGGYQDRFAYRPDGALAWAWNQLGCCDVSSNPPAIDLATGVAYWTNNGPWRVDLRDSPPARVLAQTGSDIFAELSLAGAIGYSSVQFTRWGAVERWDLRTLTSLGVTDVARGQRLFNAIDARGGVVVTSDSGVVARVAPDGTLDFSAARQASTPPVITGDDRVVYGAGSALEAFSLEGTSVAWSVPTPTPVVDVLVADCGNIYALLADPPAIYVVDAATGAVRHVLSSLPGSGARQVILEGSTLYVSLADRVVALPAASNGYEPSSTWPVRYHDNQRTGNASTPL